MKASIVTKEFVYQPQHNHSSFEFDEEEEKVEEKHVCEVYQVGVCRGVASLDLEKERIERCRDQRRREDLLKIQRRREWKGEMQRATTSFMFRNATLGLGLKHFLFILFFF